MPVNYKNYYLTGLGPKVVSAVGHNYLKQSPKCQADLLMVTGEYQSSMTCSGCKTPKHGHVCPTFLVKAFFFH